MHNGQSSILNDNENINHSSNVRSSQYVTLQIEYTDRQDGLLLKKKAQFLPTNTIREVIKEFLKLVRHEHIRPENVQLIAINPDRRLAVPKENADMTLQQLKIVDDYTLYIEPSLTSVTSTPSYLSICGPINLGKMQYKWYKTTTTLRMLLEYIIKIFSLESIQRERIYLTIVPDKKLDHMSNSDKLLSELGIDNNALIHFKLIPLPSSQTDTQNVNVHVECNYLGKKLLIDIPLTNTIDELKDKIQKQYESRLLLDFVLSDEMKKKIDIRDSGQMLYTFGIKPGQTIYADLRLAFSNNQSSTVNTPTNIAPRSSSLIMRDQPDEVTVICKYSTCVTTTPGVSVNDTVAEMIKKIDVFKRNRPLVQYQMCCGSIDFDAKDPNRRLADFGIKSGDTINVSIKDNLPVQNSNNSSDFKISNTPDELSRTQQFSSRPIGLANLGNTCYMNSALQCLSHVIPLTNFFLDGLTRGISDDDKDIDPEWNQFYTVGPVTGAYTDVLRNLWLPNKTAYYISSFRPTHIKETVGLKAPRFATWDQQDAQEFMTFLLDEIHKELKEKNGSESNNIIEELFFGKIQSTITCLECKHEVKTINPISFLPLPLTQPGRLFVIKFIGKNGDNDCATVSVPENGQVKSLIQAFVESRPSHSFFRTIIAMTDDGQLDLEMPLNKLSIPEVILVEEDDFASSTPYNRFNRSSKQLTLEGCLREFCSLESLEDSWLCEQETCKKHTKATKQLQFYSLPPILIIQFKRFSHKDGLREKIETFVDYPIDGLDLSSFLSSGEEAVYDLFAVIMHTGSIYDGHYISFARHETNGRSSWYKFDDAYVTSVYYKEEIVSRNAYLLFYIKRDKSKQSTTTMSS